MLEWLFATKNTTYKENNDFKNVVTFITKMTLIGKVSLTTYLRC